MVNPDLAILLAYNSLPVFALCPVRQVKEVVLLCFLGISRLLFDALKASWLRVDRLLRLADLS